MSTKYSSASVIAHEVVCPVLRENMEHSAFNQRCFALPREV
jgi:hypothetical protein